MSMRGNQRDAAGEVPMGEVREDADLGTLFRTLATYRTMVLTNVKDEELVERLRGECDEALMRLSQSVRERHALLAEHDAWGTSQFGTLRKNAKRLLRQGGRP